LEDSYLYLRVRNMSHTIYAVKFVQTIIHQHVHLQRESQSHAPAHVLMRLYPIDKWLVCLQSESPITGQMRVTLSYRPMKMAIRRL
jgi:hypothetical protein